MHGIIFKGLKDFVVDAYDRAAWRAILDEAGLGGKLYVPVTEYPDEELLAIVHAAAKLTGESPAVLQRAFGRHVVPTLVDVYAVHVDGDWTGIDLVANVEAYVHEALRAKRLSEFTPPGLGGRRVDEHRALVTYSSNRELCPVAHGLLEGVGDHYDERFEVTERTCMHDGADQCRFLVTRRPAPGRRERAGTAAQSPAPE